MNTSQKNFMVPLAFVGMMFFAIGFALGINSFLMPVLERSMEMSASESNLLLAATFVPFLIFGIPATKCIEAIGYKKTMALSFIIFAIAFGLFIQAAATESIVWFLFASFICGAANAVLQASVNPYVTILGPIESAAKRISIMGICNKLAWPATTLFITLVIGKTIDQIKMEDLFQPFGIIIGIFVVLGIIALMAPLPEVKAAGEDATTDAEEAVGCPYAEGENYADNLQNIYVSRVSGADISITLSSLSKKIEAALTGKAYEKGEIETNTADIQQKVAILYQINYDDGSYDNRIYYNCKLRKEEYGGKTQTDKIDFTACDITGKAIPLSNGKVFYEIASDEVGSEDTDQKKKLDNFFKTVQFKDVADATV